MNRHINGIPIDDLKGEVLYAILENKIRKCELWGKFNGKPIAQVRWHILLIDEESMCEPINDAVRLVKSNELFINRQAAEKEIFKRKLKGKSNE